MLGSPTAILSVFVDNPTWNPYYCYIIEIDCRLVNYSICQLLKHILVLVVRRSPAVLVLASVSVLIVLVHRVVVIVKVIVADCDVSECRCDGLLGRRLVSRQEVLECICVVVSAGDFCSLGLEESSRCCFS